MTLLMITAAVAVMITLLFSPVGAFSNNLVRDISLGGPPNNNKNVEKVVQYDVVVVGGGSAGLTAAKFAKTFGASVVIIEGNKLGGDCTWTGCVPSKSLIASATAVSIATNARRQRQFDNVQQQQTLAQLSSDLVDFASIRQEIQQKIQRIYDAEDSPQVMARLGIHVLQGQATLASSHRLTVNLAPTASTKTAEMATNEVSSSSSSSKERVVGSNSIVVEAQQGIILCTGARPRMPSALEIPGIDLVDYLTYEQVWELTELPKRLTIVGGGPIGCELAQSFARLGSEVTLIAEVLLPESEPEVGPVVEQVFQDDGIRLVKGRLVRVEQGINKAGHVAICQGAAAASPTIRIDGDKLLLAVGRIPNVENMGLENIGIQLNEQGGIQVNRQLLTSVSNIYAAGDCTGDRQFTHYAGYQGAIAARNILLPFSDVGVISPSSGIPSTTFTSPQVSAVGWKERDAKDHFGSNAVAVAMKRLDQVSDRAICDDAPDGCFIKLIYRKRNLQILGATIVAPVVAGEMISEISVAVKAGMKLDQLATVMHSYPTYSIALQIMAAEVYYAELQSKQPILKFLKRLGL